MKRFVAIVLLALMTMLVFTGCKREGEMIETMVSSIFSTESRNDMNNNTPSSGKVTDSDGYIDENNENNTTAPENSMGNDNTTRTSDNSIM